MQVITFSGSVSNFKSIWRLKIIISYLSYFAIIHKVVSFIWQKVKQSVKAPEPRGYFIYFFLLVV